MNRRNGISVEDLMDLEVMGKSKLIAGFKGVRNTISKVNVMADPDIMDWVEEGEFLLTTAYFLNEGDVGAQKDLISKCFQAGLAGLGIKISPYIKKLDDQAIKLANDLNFPVIDLHYSIPLSDIMMTAIKEIFDKQASLLQRIEKVHERFMTVMTDGKGAEDIVKAVHEYIRNPVVLHLNTRKEVIEGFDGISDKVIEEFRKEVHSFYNNYNYRNRHKKLDEDRVLIDDKYVKRMILPIVVKGDVYGHIFAWGTNTPLGGYDLSIMESASTAIALAVLQDLSVKEVEIKYRSEYFEDLISLDQKRKAKALERAHFFNLQRSDYHVVEVISFKPEDEEKEEEFSIDFLQEHLYSAVAIIDDIMKYLKIKGIVSAKKNGVQLVLGFIEEESILHKLDQFNQSMVESLKERFKGVETRIGIGRAYEDLENVDKSFNDAVRAIRIGKSILDKEIVTYDELGIYKILCHDNLKDELLDFYNSVLKALVDYDKKKSTDLVITLESYFNNNGNLTKVSEELFTHYNTVLYRISRIKEITGLDLNNPNHRLNLEIALKIKELLDN